MNHRRIWISLAVSFILFLGLAISFGSLADEVHEGDTLAFDQSVLRAVNEYSSPFLDAFFVGITEVGGVIGISIITLAVLILLVAKHHYRRATIVFASVAGATLTNVILKLLFERARPDLWEQLVVETSYSFPSGHSMMSSVVATLLIVLCWHTKYRIAALFGGIAFMVLVSLSRLYLGVHYPTDVLGGWCVGIAWVLVVVAIVDGWALRRARRQKNESAQLNS